MNGNNLTDFNKCLLNRQKIAENTILPIIEGNEKESLRLTINAEWGFGKTTFLNMLKTFLEEKDYQVINFNAWEADYYDDPFLAIYTELIEDKDLKESTIEYANNIAKKTFFSSLKILSYLAPVGQGILQEGISGIEKLFDDNQIEINEYSKLKEDLNKFRKQLNEHCASQEKPTIFIIDELDRCKPIYAIKLLETIKHFFCVENIIFIFGIDRNQLSHSAKALYGQDMDTNGYLRRFFDLEIQLPKPEYSSYIKSLYNPYIIKQDDYYFFDNYFAPMIVTNSLSLRDINKLFIRWKYVFRSQYIQQDILVSFYLIILKIKDEDLFFEIKNKEITIETFIKRSKILNLMKSDNLITILQFDICYYLSSEKNLNNIDQIIEKLKFTEDQKHMIESQYKSYGYKTITRAIYNIFETIEMLII